MSQLLFMYLCFVRSDAKHAFPVKYTLPIQYLPTDLKVKQEKKYTVAATSCAASGYLHL